MFDTLDKHEGTTYSREKLKVQTLVCWRTFSIPRKKKIDTIKIFIFFILKAKSNEYDERKIAKSKVIEHQK